MRSKKNAYYRYLLLFLTLALYAALYAATASAQVTGTTGLTAAQTTGTTTASGTVGIGIHGIVPGETARFSVFNQLAPNPCNVEVVVLDITGRVLLDQRVIVLPGHATQVDFIGPVTPPTTPANPFSRTEFRGICRATDVQSTLRCSMSLEIFDQSTGKKSLFEPSDPCSILNSQFLPAG